MKFPRFLFLIGFLAVDSMVNIFLAVHACYLYENERKTTDKLCDLIDDNLIDGLNDLFDD